LNKWFESDILIATLATDAIIGSMTSPYIQGSSYVLLHHIMGSIEGHEGSWAYVKGGMGAISEALAKSAREKGVEIICNSDIEKVLMENKKATGIRLVDGKEIYSKIVLSNATPEVTFKHLVDPKDLP
jgi:phytoene dehydrogenase-like protein